MTVPGSSTLVMTLAWTPGSGVVGLAGSAVSGTGPFPQFAYVQPYAAGSVASPPPTAGAPFNVPLDASASSCLPATAAAPCSYTWSIKRLPGATWATWVSLNTMTPSTTPMVLREGDPPGLTEVRARRNLPPCPQ